jgi:hypothetical protein
MSRVKFILSIFTLLALLSCDSVSNRIQQKVEQKVNEKIDKTIDDAMNKNGYGNQQDEFRFS